MHLKNTLKMIKEKQTKRKQENCTMHLKNREQIHYRPVGGTNAFIQRHFDTEVFLTAS